jgi:hypothetical protein
MLKKLFYASASILMLAFAYHLGASTATAQAPSNSPVAMVSGVGGTTMGANGAIVTANGDVYATLNYADWFRIGNIFTGPPTSAPTQSWGALKAKYR